MSPSGCASYDLAGYRFRVCWEESSGRAIASRLFSSCRVEAVPAGADVYGIAARSGQLEAWRGESVIATADSDAELAAQLDTAIANAALEHRTDAVAIHAGAVARDDRALVLAGRGGSGKTTLTVGLALAGLHPLCDDMLLVDGDRQRVRALPRSFLLKGEAGAQLAGRIPGVADCAFGNGLYSVPREVLGSPVDEAAAAWIVFPTYIPGSAVELTPIGHLEAMERILPLTCLPHQELFGVVGLVKGGESYTLTYGSHEEAVLTLQGLSG